MRGEEAGVAGVGRGLPRDISGGEGDEIFGGGGGGGYGK